MVYPSPKDVLAALRANRFQHARDYALREHRAADVSDGVRHAIRDGRYQDAVCDLARDTGDWLL